MSDDVELARLRTERTRVTIAVVMWVSLVLGVTISRAVPALPGAVELLMRGVGVVSAGYLIAVRGPALTGPRVSVPLLLGFASIPALGALLALARSEPGDAVNHLASLLSLVAVSCLSPQQLARSIRRALAVVAGASLLLGVVYPPVVEPNERGFLRPLYDGRLVGLAGSANVLGTVGLLLAVVGLIASTGRARAAYVALGAVAIAASSSQTSLAVLLLVLVVAAALTLRRSGRGPGLVVAGTWGAAAVLTGVVVWLNAPGGRDVGGMLSGITFSRRTDVWDAALRLDVPFLGIGQSAIQSFFETTTIQGAIGISSVHNGLLDGYLRDGVPGLVVLVLMLLTLLVVAVRARADLVLLPVLAFVVVGSLEVFPTHVPWYALVYGLVLVAVAYSDEPVLGRRPSPGPEGPGRTQRADWSASSAA